MVLLQLCFLLIHPLGKPFYGLVATVQVCWSQGCYTVGVPSAVWTSAGTSSGTLENPLHGDTLPDESVKKARDKAVTPDCSD